MALIRRGLVMNDYIERLGTKDTYKAKFEALCAAIDNAPAVDAVEVVRCKDCKNHGKCTFEDTFITVGINDGYCRVGAKMDEEQE